MAFGRILDFSLTPVKLRMRNRQLKVMDGETERDSVPIDDIAVVVLSHPQISVSLALLQQLFDADVAVVVCDQKSIPNGLCLPLYSYHAGAQRTRLQIEASSDKPLVKRIWRQIVKHKIKNQAQLLQSLFQDDAGLLELYKSVKSGDSDNRESVAARRYWARLFEGSNFKRDYNGEDPVNAALNYGYSILRAIVARSVVAGGLCASLGVAHRSKYNGFALADDLIEPFRPVVDCCVYGLLGEDKLDKELTPSVKGRLLRQITGRYLVNGNQETIFETSTKAVESLIHVFQRESFEIVFPTRLPFEPVDSFYLPIKKKKERIEKKREEKQTKKPPF